MTKNLSESPENIIKRLEKLRQWQEEQQKILVERQNTQRQLLNLEQRKMYEMLGLSRDSSISENFDNSQSMKERRPLVSEEGVTYLNNMGQGDGIQCEKNNQQSPSPNVRKKPFLKRGEGLKNRFKMDPDAFRLNNLPKYKYANAHKKFVEKRTNKAVGSKSVVHNKKGAEQLHLQKPKKQSSNRSHIRCASINEELTDDFALNVPEVLTAIQEKLGTKNESLASTLENNLELYKIEENPDVSRNSTGKEKLQISSSSKELLQICAESSPENMQIESAEPISWAKVLDPKNPIPIQQFRRNSSTIETKSQDELENISLFELLEKKAEEGSFSLNFSSIRRWVTTKRNLDLSIEEENKSRSSFAEQLKSIISPVPFDIEKRIVVDGSDGEISEAEENPKRNKARVRFSENVQTNEVESDAETVLSNDLEAMDISKTSTPNDKMCFEKFKAELFAEDEPTEEYDSTLVDDKNIFEEKKQEILEKSNLLKSRLAELENEISTFKQHNAELTRLKQEHELEKIQLKQEKIEIEEKLNDERIKVEIYLHDERMKIEEEKKKVEKMLKEQKLPNRREREEITKLRDNVESLQQELKNKENKHVAAQSRLRAQIRVLEKEVKELNFETEHLKKEIKKLESENARLNRMNNSKMLQEINKTIAKLAPKVETTEVKNKNPKAVVAKVVSHQRKSTKTNSRSKSVPDLTRDESDSTCEETDDISSGESSKAESEHTQYFHKNGSCDKSTGRKRSKSDDRFLEKRKSQIENSKNSCKNDFRREIVNTDGSKDIWYPNGNLKKISADGMIIRMLYYNKDIKETNITEGTVKYYYAETNTWHTTYLDGLEILEFPNGQTEHRYKDGTIEVHFSNGSVRISNPTDEHKAEEWRYPDGTKLVQMKNGDKILSLPNGQKEIHTKIHKRREYPDGTVKIVYPDGSQETRYSNGRVRLKDKDGNLVMDSENSNY